MMLKSIKPKGWQKRIVETIVEMSEAERIGDEIDAFLEKQKVPTLVVCKILRFAVNNVGIEPIVISENLDIEGVVRKLKSGCPELNVVEMF